VVYGAGISAGIEAAPRRLQLLHEHDPSLCTWSKDCKNAFQTLDGHAIRDCLREHDPELHSFFCAYCSSPRRQWYRNADGSVSMVALSCQGVTQGDALSAIIFDLVYTYKVLKPACDRFTDAHFARGHSRRHVLRRLLTHIDDVTKFVCDYLRCGGTAVGDPAAVEDDALRAARVSATRPRPLAGRPPRGARAHPGNVQRSAEVANGNLDAGPTGMSARTRYWQPHVPPGGALRPASARVPLA
jgi:hypothetical protein